MQLLLIRHAIATPRGPDIDDATRPLTPAGRKRMGRAVRGLERLGASFDRLYHSPWLRAAQTAELLAGLCDGDVVSTERLAQSPTPALLNELEGQRVGLVGHEPRLSELLALLLLGTTERASRFLLGKGGVAWLSGEARPGGMVLEALLTPKAMRRIREQ
jgi:phosphohistidine phosphatase